MSFSLTSSASLPYWEALEIVSLFVVWVGVFGEYKSEREKSPFNPTNFLALESKKEGHKKFWGWVLISGLALEAVASIFVLVISNKEIAGLNKEAADERLKAAQLEAQLTPRILKFPDSVSARLSRYSGTRAILFCSKESRDEFIGQQIFFALKDAGWNVDIIGTEVMTPGVAVTCFPFPGLGHGLPKQSDINAETSLFEELTNSDIKTSVNPILFDLDPSITFKGVVIQVGPKPTPVEAQLIDFDNFFEFNHSADERQKMAKRQMEIVTNIIFSRGPIENFTIPAKEYPPQ
jgi:hypothetical protein